MKHTVIAHALGEPFPTPKRSAPCKWPWCTRDMPTDDSEFVVHAEFDSPIGTGKGAMHVTHTDLAPRYNNGLTEWYEYDDGKPELPDYADEDATRPDFMDEVKLVPAPITLRQIVDSVPTEVTFVSNVDKLINKLDVGEYLIISKTAVSSSTRYTPVLTWRKRP